MLKKTTLKLSLGLLGSYAASVLINLIFVLTLISLTTNAFVNGIVEFVAILIFAALIYGTAWNEGFKDPNRINYGHMEKFMLKGLVAGLIADIPLVIAYFVALISHLAGWHRTITSLIFWLMNVQFLESVKALSAHRFYLLFLFCIPIPLISCAGYILGYKRISIMQKIVYKKKEPKRDSKINKMRTR